jgi:hypothetical protein
MVQSALRAMVNDRLPDQGIVPVLFKKLPGDGFEVHQTLLSREGSGDRVPTIGVVPNGFDKTVVIWAHPDGKSSLFEPGTDRLIPAARKLLDQKMAILASDLFLTGEMLASGQPPTLPKLEQKYHQSVPCAAYTFGYNRTVLAQRVHDLLTLIAFARTSVKAREVHLLGFREAGVWALLARTLSGDLVDRAVLDLDDFDFHQVDRFDHPMMLPGALKYGGVYGFAAACPSGAMALFGAPDRPTKAWLDNAKGVSIVPQKGSPDAQVNWLLR